MTILLPVALAMAGLTVWGFIVSRKQRGIDRRHFAAFVGFSGAVFAVTATTACLVAAGQPARPSSALQGFLFVSGSIAIVAILVTVFAGLFSRGVQRLALVSCGIVVGVIYLFALVSHFGD